MTRSNCIAPETGEGLKESKDYVDALRSGLRSSSIVNSIEKTEGETEYQLKASLALQRLRKLRSDLGYLEAYLRSAEIGKTQVLDQGGMISVQGAINVTIDTVGSGVQKIKAAIQA